MLSREPLLGTRGTAHVEASSSSVADRIEGSILDHVEQLEGVFTVFDQHSELSKFRRTGSTTNDDLTEVVRLAQHSRATTQRAFDPYCQPIFDAWDSGEMSGQVPEQSELDAIVAKLDEPDLSLLNLNAIAKGWIGERALTSALDGRDDCSSGWITLGGDLTHRGESPMVVGIENPLRPYDNEPPLARIDISNESLATSGGSRRWWTIADRRWPKVLDPRTGVPVDRVASATVVAPNAADADVLATVLLIIDEEEWRALLLEHGALGLIVQHDGSVLSTSERFELSDG